MALISVTPPTAEPLNLIEAKLHLRVDISDDDALVQALIGAARDYAENFTSRQFVGARWKQYFDKFPGAFGDSSPLREGYSRPGNAIYLERAPVLKVVSIQYIDLQQITQTVDPTTYVIDYAHDPVRITPVFGQIWPIPVPQIASVWVTFDAGYAAPITADATANTIAVSGWPDLSVNYVMRLSNSGGSLPPPLKPATDYYVQSIVSAGVYKLAATSGGAAIDITGAGTGTSYLGVIPEGITSWLKIRLGTLYENREEVAILGRGKVEPLPYVDRLLDGYKTYRF